MAQFYYDRYKQYEDTSVFKGYNEANQAWDVLLAVAGRIAQSAEINELQSILAEHQKRVADTIFEEGDVVADSQLVIQGNIGSQYVNVTSGRIYLKGRVRDVDGTSESLSIEGEGLELIGVVETEQIVTEVDEPTLRDPAGGYPGYNAKGMHRLVLNYTWAWKHARRITSTDYKLAGETWDIFTSNNKLNVKVGTSVGTTIEYTNYEVTLAAQYSKTPEQVVSELNVVAPSVIYAFVDYKSHALTTSEAVAGRFVSTDRGSTYVDASTFSVGDTVDLYDATNAAGDGAVHDGRIVVMEHVDPDGTLDLEGIDDNAYETLGFRSDYKIIPVHRISDGKILTYVRPVSYSSLYQAMAVRTFEESGNYTVIPFTGRKVPHADPNKFYINFSAGKAYVQGFRIETSSRSVAVNKSRINKEEILSEDKILTRDETYVLPMNNSYVKNVSFLNGKVLYRESNISGTSLHKLSDGTIRILQVHQGGTWDDQCQRFTGGTDFSSGGCWYQTNSTQTTVGTGDYIAWYPIGSPPACTTHPTGSYSVVWEASYTFEKGYRTLTNVTGESITRDETTLTMSGMGLAASVEGSAGSQDYYYAVTALKGSGETSIAESTGDQQVDFSNGVATNLLSETNYNKLTWNVVTDATGYRIYRKLALGDPWEFLVEVPTWQNDGSSVWWHDHGTVSSTPSITPPVSDTTKYVDLLTNAYADTATIAGYTEGVDFTLFDGQFEKEISYGAIHWAAGAGPGDGNPYIVDYSYWAEKRAASLEGSISELDDADSDGVTGFRIIANYNDEITLGIDSNPNLDITLAEGSGLSALDIVKDINDALDDAGLPEVASVSDNLAIKFTSTTAGASSRIELLATPNPTQSAYSTLGLSITTVNGEDNTTGDFLSADSYSDYESIPTFTEKSGLVLYLRDSVDFRPYKAPTSPPKIHGYNPYLDCETEESEMDADYKYYLARKDGIYLTDKGYFYVREGSPDVEPLRPILPSQFLRVAYVDLPPYVYDLSDVTIEYLDTKRYTMDDIRVLEKRIDVLEYYKAIDALNSETLDEDTPGAGSYTKAGVFTDLFTGAGRQDVSFLYEDATVIQGDTGTGPIVLDLKNEIGTDARNQQIRLPFTTNNATPSVNASTTTARIKDARVTPNIDSKVAMLPFTDEVVAKQPYATRFVDVVPYMERYNGTLTLTPASDMWMDTTDLPDLNVNFQGERDNVTSDAEALWSETEWGFWETNWSGVSTESTTETETTAAGTTTTVSSVTTKSESQSREGVKKSFVPEAITKSLGDRIVDVSIIPYIRAHSFSAGTADPIIFEGVGFEPNRSDFTLTFDGDFIEVRPHDGVGGTQDYVPDLTYPFTSYAYGANGHMKTDANGYIKGAIIIPEGTYLTGSKHVRLFAQGAIEKNATAQATFEASGLKETRQETFMTVEVINQVEEVVTEERNLTSVTANDSQVSFEASEPPQPPAPPTPTPPTPPSPPPTPPPEPKTFTERLMEMDSDILSGADPVAQTFVTTKDTLYLSRVDVYFAAKPDTAGGDANLPVIMDIRPVINGYPSSKTITTAYLMPDDVNVNATKPDTATSFYITSPVLLEKNKEFCMVFRSASLKYQIYVCDLGDEDLVSGKRITKQPHSGVFLSSANGRTWTPNQSRDIMFTLYRAKFSTSGTLNFSAITTYDDGSALNGGTVLLNVDQIVADGTSINWFYRLGSGAWMGFEPRTIKSLNAIATSISFKAELKGSAYLSPMISLERLNAIFSTNKLIGNYVSHPVNVGLNWYATDPPDLDNLQQALTCWFETTNTSPDDVEAYFSIDNGEHWFKFTSRTSTDGAVTTGFTELKLENDDIADMTTNDTAASVGGMSDSTCFLPFPAIEPGATTPSVETEVEYFDGAVWQTLATTGGGTVTYQSEPTTQPVVGEVHISKETGQLRFSVADIASYGGSPVRVKYKMDFARTRISSYRIWLRLATASAALTPKVKRLRTSATFST